MGRALKKPDKPHCYEFRMVSVTVDCVIFGWDTDGLHVLLIERGESPYEGRWALPGGFIRAEEENLEQAARRELVEETGIRAAHLEQLGTYGDPKRDPREIHVITVAYVALVRRIDHKPRGGTDARSAHWVPIEESRRMTLAFDHDQILTDAIAIGNATVRALAFRPRSETIWYYGPEGSWYSAFDGGDYRWLIDGGNGGRNRDARSLFFYIATVNTPAMVLEMVGVGSQYALASTDSEGQYLDGSRQYKLTIPADVPAKDFWSLVVYDPQTRSMLQTDQPYPSKNNERNKDLATNTDGSTTIWFGPKPPKGHEANWIQTVPGKGWFICLRLYGPLEPWFDKTWRPGEIELVD